jgi:hypothetical protein
VGGWDQHQDGPDWVGWMCKCELASHVRRLNLTH